MDKPAETTSKVEREKKEVTITSSGKEYLPKAVDIISRTFVDDPIIKFQLSSLSESERLAYLPRFIHCIIKAGALNNGFDWSCCAVWMPPGKRIDNSLTMVQAGILSVLWTLGLGGCKRMLIDFVSQSDAAKRKHLTDASGKPLKRYHYLYFIATDFHARGQGLASRVIQQMQVQATKDGLPIWLEATTTKSRDIYARQGFETVQEIILGKGTHASTGLLAAAGEDAPGVPLYAMLWRPKK